MVERQIVVPLEGALASLPGLARLESEATPGAAILTLRLDGRVDVGRAREEVMARLEGARRDLPSGADAVLDVHVAAGAPPVVFAVRSQDGAPLHPPVEAFRRALIATSGVGPVTLCGDRRPRVVVRVDPERLRALVIALDGVQAALDDVLRGSVVPGTLARAAPADLSDISDAIVGAAAGSPIRLRDLATVAVEVEPPGCDAVDGGGLPAVVGAAAAIHGARVGDGLAVVREALSARAPELASRGARLEIAGPEAATIVVEVPASEHPEETLGELRRRVAEALGDAWPSGAFLRAQTPRVAGEPVDVEVLLPAGHAALARLEGRLASIPGLRVVDVITGTSPPPLRLRVVDNDLERGRRIAAEVVALALATPGVRSARARVELAPEVEVEPDRERLAALGVTPRELSLPLMAALDGVPVGDFYEDGERLSVLLELGPEGRRSRVERLAELPALELVLAGRPPLRLSEVADLRLVESPRRIVRVDHQRSIDVDVRLAEPAARAGLQRSLASGLRLPEGVVLVWE